MAPTAVIYSRISRDTEGTGAGVERQRQDCLDLCKRRGWDVADVLVDNDVSAYSGKHRPDYARLLDLIEHDKIDVLVAWHPDRLHRSPIELERFVEVVEAHRVQVATVTAGDVDLSTPEGRLMARITGAVARKESEDKSRRLRRKHRELAEQGRVSGGGNRPFGFRPDRITHDRAEARLIVDAARRVLAGESLYSIVSDWTERGIPTVTGAKWTTTHLRTLLLSPRVAGLRTNGGETFPAVWSPILDRETWESVGHVIRSRSRSRTRPARSYLLSGGLLRCDRCGAAMVAAPRPYGRAYACLSSHGGCNGTTIKAEPVEDLIVETVLAAIDTDDLAAKVAEPKEDDDPRDDLAAVDRRLDELAEMFAAGEIGRTEWATARKALDARRLTAEERMAARATPLDAYRAKGALRKQWPDLGVDQRRTILGAVVEAVKVAPAGRAGGRVDLDRISVEWKA